MPSRRARLARLREITQVMVTHGLGFLLVQAGLGHLVPRLRRRFPSRGYEVRAALEELGPTFIKLGQLLSTRRDLLPPDVVAELEGLQDRAPAFPLAQVRQVIGEELGGRVEQFFASFTEEPVAAASIGQVHSAFLPDGQRVAVKVQRPGIQEQVETDLAILEELATLVEARTAWGSTYGVRDLVQEFARTIRGELDYHLEADRCRRFGENFAGDPDVRIPAVLEKLSSRRVLTLQYEGGVKITDVAELEARGYDRSRLARKLVRAMMRQVFQHGLFHADPHPGNVSVLPGEVLFFMDFGQVGSLSPVQLELLQEAVLALARRDVDSLVQVALELGAGGDIDQAEFTAEVGRIMERYYAQSLGTIDPVQAFREGLDLARRFHVRIPAAFALLGKSFATLEAVVAALDPSLSVMDVARPVAREILRRRLSFESLWQRTTRDLESWWGMIGRLPRRLERVVSKLDRDSLHLRFSLHDQRLLRRLERVANRLSLSILFLAVAVLAAGLLVAGTMRGTLSLPAWALSPGFLASTMGGSALALLILALLLTR